MAKGDDIEEGLRKLAALVLSLCDMLPRTPKGSHIAGQLMRCGTACGANYAEARASESRDDFIHKLAIVLKELNETRYWLDVILNARMVDPELIEPVKEKCIVLSKILAVSRRTAAENAGKISRR
jgi:four helix bundle protein